MAWKSSVIRDHKEAAVRLTKIAQDAFEYLGEHPRATEGEVKDFILKEFRRRGLVMDKPFRTPIVGFGSNSTDPHYRPVPGARRLRPGTIVMIDVWGRLQGKHKPYADITWMGYYGGPGNRKAPKEMQKVFDAVLAARDTCFELVHRGARRGALPVGSIADEAANAVIRKRGYGKFIRHSTGHVLGFASPHGNGRNLNRKNKHPLLKNFGYTIEPGIYIKGRFGVRSEMNFYVDASGKVVVTTPLQRRLVMI
jgi:Xaa-Pro aminopeptidase